MGEASHGVSEGFIVAARARHVGWWANGCGYELFVNYARMGFGGGSSDPDQGWVCVEGRYFRGDLGASPTQAMEHGMVVFCGNGICLQ